MKKILYFTSSVDEEMEVVSGFSWINLSVVKSEFLSKPLDSKIHRYQRKYNLCAVLTACDNVCVNIAEGLFLYLSVIKKTYMVLTKKLC